MRKVLTRIKNMEDRMDALVAACSGVPSDAGQSAGPAVSSYHIRWELPLESDEDLHKMDELLQDKTKMNSFVSYPVMLNEENFSRPSPRPKP